MAEWQPIEATPEVNSAGEKYGEYEPFVCDVYARRYWNRNKKFRYRRFINVSTYSSKYGRKWELAYHDNQKKFRFDKWEPVFWIPSPRLPEVTHA